MGSTTRPTVHQPLDLLGAIGLLAAVAAGLALIRATGYEIYNEESYAKLSFPRFVLTHVPGTVSWLVAPMLVALSLAVLILGRTRWPAPWRRWARQPGVVGPMAVVATLAIDGAWYAAIWAANPKLNPTLLASAVGRWGNLGFVAIASGWLGLWSTGRWRRPLRWSDRLGVWLGWLWLGSWSTALACSVILFALR
jgi:Zn-dependent protease with chaperone function